MLVELRVVRDDRGDRCCHGLFQVARRQCRLSRSLPSGVVTNTTRIGLQLATFDSLGHRIGYGAGYYDRTLAGLRARKKIIAVGVAYAAQETAKRFRMKAMTSASTSC